MKLKDLAYRWLDAITFQKGFACHVNGFRVYFPAKWFRYFEPDYEKENILFLKNTITAGMTVIDIGAHLGLMSNICAQLTGPKGQVHAFEPTPSTFAVLKKTILLNGAGRIIHAHNKAVSNFVGETDFFMDEHEGSNSNSLVNRVDRKRSPHKTQVTTLDAFVTAQGLSRLDLVKIDAEGSELDVLEGARLSLQRFMPKVILAMHPPFIRNNGHKPGDIYDLLMALNYDVLFKGQPLAKADFCSIEDLFDVHLLPKIRS